MPSLFPIAPGDPDKSYLVGKVTSVNITGRQMSYGCDAAAGTCLSLADIERIAAWVRAGAPDN
jgi:hypothetical protein